MTLFLIVLGLILLTAIIGAVADGGYDRSEGFVGGFFIGMILFGGIYIVSQFIGQIVNTHTVQENNVIPIVSLADGTQTEGDFYGGLFVTRGHIEGVEYFSYYRNIGNNEYILEKQLASLSTIVPDATPDTARLESISELTTCETKWWSTWCSDPSGIYVSGKFHVPNNAIKNDFNLDAQ